MALTAWQQQLIDDGWVSATEPFWDRAACFYDLGTVKTVILVKRPGGAASVGQGGDRAEPFYWRYGPHGLRAYVPAAAVELRRYKLHHSMNDLLWHDHGDRPLWPA